MECTEAGQQTKGNGGNGEIRKGKKGNGRGKYDRK